jgi:hypothetical protein
MAGDRRLVREAIAAYFGGAQETADGGIYFQNGPLASAGLGTAYPYKIKKGAPDSFYTLGAQDGTGWGAVMTVGLGVTTLRDSYGGATSGWRARRYRITCALDVISYLPHLETTEAAFDDLVNGMDGLVYADRTLGTTSAAYAAQGGRLIIQAGEKPYGIVHGEAEWSVEGDRGRGEGGMEYTFEVLTMVAS